MRATRIPKGWQKEIEKGSAFGLKAKAALEKPSVVSRRVGVNRTATPGVGACLAKRIANFLTVKGSASCGCNSLAGQMDRWGPDHCKKNRKYIVDRLMQNKQMLSEAVGSLGSVAESVFGWIIGTSLLDPVLRKGAEWLLDESIKEAEQNILLARQNKRLTSRKPSPGTPVRGPLVEPIDVSNLIRNFQMHIWPSMNGAWRWNCDQVMARAELFNGRRIVAIATDNNSCSADEVKEYMKGFTSDFIVIANDPRKREVASWLPMLERQQTSNANEVTFSCHSKVSRHKVTLDQEGSTLYRWAGAMYETCLDGWDLVREQLATKAMTGSFKRYGLFKTRNNHCWHYSGTFYWFRNRDVFNRNWTVVDQNFYGTESYPGLLFHPDDTGCLFADDAGDLYKLDYWKSDIQPQLERWRNERSLQAT